MSASQVLIASTY